MHQSETKKCQNCQQEFVIEPEDFEFYEKISDKNSETKVPAPTWCPDCRLVRRLSWRNERVLHKRKCDLCKKDVISIYHDNVKFPVYCKRCWFSDKWNPQEYEQRYNFSESFFEQILGLLDSLPQIALQATKSIGSDYINQAIECKNSYLLFSASRVEDSMYSNRILSCKNISDSTALNNVNLAYQTLDSRESSMLVYCDNCIESFNLFFCSNVKNSNDCFMSSNLRFKSYVWYGRQLTKEEYREKIAGINFGSYNKLKELIEEYKILKKNSIVKFAQHKNVVKCTGNIISNSKNCRRAFSINEIENGSNLLFVDNAKDIYDVNHGCCTMENIYETNTCGVNCSRVLFSSDAWPEARNIEYCIACSSNTSDCFACIGLRKKQYCILNKQYTKEEYFKMVEKIKKHMNEMPYVDKQGREYKYGEFFPPELSPFAYNETIAQEYFPVTKEEAKEQGYRWKEPEKKNYQVTIEARDLPDYIDDVDDSILKEVIGCQTVADDKNLPKADQQAGKSNCTTAFKIIPKELEFYKKHNIPLPRYCPNCRHHQRIQSKNPLKLYKRTCQKEGCNTQFETTYAPDRPEIVYCEKCYQEEVV